MSEPTQIIYIRMSPLRRQMSQTLWMSWKCKFRATGNSSRK